MEDIYGNRIEFASEDNVQHYRIEMRRLLSAIAFYMSDDPQDWLKHCWVSDMSSVGDFGLEEADRKVISDALGVPVGENHYLWEIAKELHDKGAS